LHQNQDDLYFGMQVNLIKTRKLYNKCNLRLFILFFY